MKYKSLGRIIHEAREAEYRNDGVKLASTGRLRPTGEHGIYMPEGMKSQRYVGKVLKDKVGLLSFGTIEEWCVPILERLRGYSPFFEVEPTPKEAGPAYKYMAQLPVAEICWASTRYTLRWALIQWLTDEEFAAAIRTIRELHEINTHEALTKLVAALHEEYEDEQRERAEREAWEKSKTDAALRGK
jgi:HEAT repeat protein